MLSDYLKVNIVMIQADKGIITYGKENLYEHCGLNQHHQPHHLTKHYNHSKCSLIQVNLNSLLYFQNFKFNSVKENMHCWRPALMVLLTIKIDFIK